MLDTPLELGIFAVTVLGLALIVLRMVRLGKAPKASLTPQGGFSIGVGGSEDSDPPQLRGCAYADEHIKILKRLTDAADANLVEVRSTRRVLTAHGAALDVLLLQAKGAQLNGEVEEAREGILRAEAYREAAEEVTAGGKQ